MGFSFNDKKKASNAGKASSRKGVKNRFPNKLQREARLTALEDFISCASNGNYYVYYHINNKTKEVFYIGKGSGNRAWSKEGRNELWREYIKGGKYNISLVASNLSEKEALAIESALIKVNNPITNIAHAI